MIMGQVFFFSGLGAWRQGRAMAWLDWFLTAHLRVYLDP